MNKYSITVVVILSVILKGWTQSTPDVFSQKFLAFQSTWPKTQVYLHFNQDKFSPGDTAFFKAYFLTEELSGVRGQQLINLDVIDWSGESKLHTLFKVTNGLGQNQFVIPDTFPAGIYSVTAYSSWMKNFDQALFFKKQIAVVNKNSLMTKEQRVIKITAEGGHLVNGISNKVAIQTHCPKCVVQVIDNEGKEIARHSTDINGVSSIIFTPTNKTSYFARIVGDSAKALLPKTEDDGCSLQLTPARRVDPVKIIIASPVGSAHRDEELVILVTSRGKVFHTAAFTQGSKDFVELKIPQTSFPEGIAQVSLLSHAGVLLASRDFYCEGESQVQVKLYTIKHNFQTREKVSLEVSVTDSQGRPVAGEFSLNVFNDALLDSNKENSFSDELNILAHVRKRFLINRSDENWLTGLDNYLISSTEAIPWKEILSSNMIKPQFSFSNFIQKSGRVYYSDTGKPVPDFTDIMFYLQRSKIRYQTTVEKGKVWLAIPDLFGQDELFYLAETSFYVGGIKHGQEIHDVKIEWEEEPIKFSRPPVSKEMESPDRYASFVTKRRLIDRSYSFFTSPEKTGTDVGYHDRGPDFEKEVKGAEITVNVQDYVVFPTMAELVREVIPSLQHRKAGGKNVLYVNLPEALWEMKTGSPLYVIDGIATKNTDFFLSLKPSDLLTVKIVTNFQKLERFGLMGKNGIVMVQTKQGDVREPLDDPSKLIQGINKPLNFRAPNHADAQYLHRPDFRTTIHWSPAVKTDPNGKSIMEFFCSDDIGKLTIRIDGLTIDGKPFSAEQDIEVSLNQEKN